MIESESIIKVYIENGSVVSEVSVLGKDTLFQMLETLFEGMISGTDEDEGFDLLNLVAKATALALAKVEFKNKISDEGSDEE